MSISSEIARITNEVGTQGDLISQIKTALNGKAAGSGGEMETVVITYHGCPDPGSMLHYLDASGTLRSDSLADGTTFYVLKNSILATTDLMDAAFPSCTFIAGTISCKVFYVTG